MKRKSGKVLIIMGFVFLAAGVYINYWRFRWLIGWIGYVMDPEPKIGIIGGLDGPTGIFPIDHFLLDMNILEKAGLLLIVAAPVLIVIGIVKCRRNKHSS